MSLHGQKILVTGATGFIGNRLVEVLVNEHRANVRALVHNYTNASRIARFPIEMVRGDVSDVDAVTRAMSGCEIVFHAAFGNSGDGAKQKNGTVDGTEVIMKAAKAHGVSRVVHFSTISVYGVTGDGDLTEKSNRAWLPDDYSKFKLEAEQIALTYHRRHGLPVAVIQPTIVYGPYGGAWTITPLNVLYRHKQAIPETSGFCNAVYVDDVVDAAIRAAVRKEAIGETFLISGAAPVTWREFYGAYERMLGTDAVISLSDDAYRRARKGQTIWKRAARDLSRMVQHLGFMSRMKSNWATRAIYNGTPYVVPRGIRQWVLSQYDEEREKEAKAKQFAIPEPWRFEWQKAKTRVLIDKARQCLGYEPAFDLEAGMMCTHEWASWANLPGVIAPRLGHTIGKN